MSTERQEIRLVDEISIAMRWKLRQNAHKQIWTKGNPRRLLYLLRLEFEELVDAVFANESTERVWEEAADVANIAAMVADSYERGTW